MTLSYEKIFSRYRGRIDDPKELSMNADDLLEICTERLHNVIGDPRVIAKFKNIELDDEIQQMNFSLKFSNGDFLDGEFIIKLLSLGMEIEWMKPQIDSIKYTVQMLGGKEEKMLQNNYKAMIERFDKLNTEFSKQLGMHGYINNSYVRGDS